MSPCLERVNTVIVGGGPAGIATAAGLVRRGLDPIVLERGDTIAPAWRHHYDRLHLHTNKQISGLPERPMPREYPRYPSRDEVFSYLEGYARDEGVRVRLDTEVTSCRREGDLWVLTTAAGDVYGASNVVIATGLSHVPSIPKYPKQEIYRGDILHSAGYRNGAVYAGKHVLVVGFGNSAGEIALDLLEHGAYPHISVRSPSVVVPRDIAGVPILAMARWMSVFPPRLADWLSKPLLLATVGDVSRVGIPKARWGPLTQIRKTGKIPMLDVGTMDALRSGSIKAQPGIERFTETGVIFVSGTSEPFDAVIFATGYQTGLEHLLGDTAGLLDDTGRPLVSGRATARPGIYFCGFHEPPTGRLREIGLEAERIGDVIAADVGIAASMR